MRKPRGYAEDENPAEEYEDEGYDGYVGDDEAYDDDYEEDSEDYDGDYDSGYYEEEGSDYDEYDEYD